MVHAKGTDSMLVRFAAAWAPCAAYYILSTCLLRGSTTAELQLFLRGHRRVLNSFQ
jgi:hypothetical protein